jgi:hypothetical protein
MSLDKERGWSPEDLFLPSKKYPNGADGEWTQEENGVMVTRVYRGGYLVSKEPCTWATKKQQK